MSRLLRSAAAAALTLAAVSAVAGAANAQTYNRLVVFGDSLSDNGNLFAATGGAQPPAAFYYQGRFSNGPVFSELLGFNAGRIATGGSVTGSINLAFGGALTGVAASPLGMRTQLLTYLGAGGQFGANDLVTVWGGANNVFQNLAAAGGSSNPVGAITPIANTAAADINFIVGSVASAGAGTVLVANLPKLSLTPQFRTSPAAGLADYAVTTFNTALLTQLTATAAANPTRNIILMDVFKIGDTISANPGAFGLTNVTDACFNQSTLTVCSTPGTYFYYDGVHPTAAGHAIIAALANDYLYYGDAGAQTALQGETAFRHREDSLDNASEALSGRHAWEAGTGVTVMGLVDQTETDARGVVGSAESKGRGARMALESGNESLRFGVAGSWREAEVEGGGQDFTLTSMGLDLYGGLRSGDVFVNAAVGISRDDYNDIDRATTLAPIVHTASTSGVSKGARLQAGMWWDMGGDWAVSPRAAVTWVSSNVDGYFEQGVSAQYRYADRTVEGVSAEVALRAEGQMGPWAVFVEGGYRDALDDSSDAVRTDILNNPASALSRHVEEPFGGQVLASAGVVGDMGPFKLEVGYRGRFGEHADSHMGGLTLRLPL